MRKLSGPQFLNVDLEVWSHQDLGPFAKAVESLGVVLYAGKVRRRFLASVEANPARGMNSPERTMWALLKILKTLPPAARRLWRQADSRVFNVGYDGGEFLTLFHERPVGSGRWHPRKADAARWSPCKTTLSLELLRAVAGVGGTIVTTIYPPSRQVSSRRPGKGRRRRGRPA